MVVLNRGQERDEDLAPAARRGDAYVADKIIRPIAGQKLDKICLQLSRNKYCADSRLCLVRRIHTGMSSRFFVFKAWGEGEKFVCGGQRFCFLSFCAGL